MKIFNREPFTQFGKLLEACQPYKENLVVKSYGDGSFEVSLSLTENGTDSIYPSIYFGWNAYDPEFYIGRIDEYFGEFKDISFEEALKLIQKEST